MKACDKCSEYKQLEDFYRNIFSEDERGKTCRKCLDEEAFDKYKLLKSKDLFRKIIHKIKKISHSTTNYSDVLGYNLDQLKNHLDRMNMNWDSDQVDHMVPISWFKPSTPSYIIHSLYNLQPLNEYENKHKNNIYAHPIDFHYYKQVIEYVIPLYKKKLKIK